LSLLVWVTKRLIRHWKSVQDPNIVCEACWLRNARFHLWDRDGDVTSHSSNHVIAVKGE